MRTNKRAYFLRKISFSLDAHSYCQTCKSSIFKDNYATCLKKKNVFSKKKIIFKVQRFEMISLVRAFSVFLVDRIALERVILIRRGISATPREVYRRDIAFVVARLASSSWTFRDTR